MKLYFVILHILKLYCTQYVLLLRFILAYQAHVADGIQFVRNIANSAASDETSLVQDKKDAQCNTSSNGDFESKVISKVDILIIDVDSADSR